VNSSPPPRLHLLHAENLLLAGFRHGFATRIGGVSEGAFASLNFGAGDSSANVAANLARLAEDVGFEPDALRQVTQVHGARVVDARSLESAEARVEADALVLRPGAGEPRGAGPVAGAPDAVGVRVADCVPVLVGSRATGAVAAIHAGWRGIVAGVVAAGLNGLAAEPSPTEERVAATGPSIGPCCFEVDADVARQIAHACGDPSVVAREERGKAFVDLRRAVRAQLAALGVTDVEDVPGCTKCEPERFFSYRRDGALSGRHLAVIARRH